jgi:hypothetical protein
MPYALIPDGFVLKKVTKAEQAAVNEYFGRQRRASYLNTLIDNPQTSVLLGGVISGSLIFSLIEKLFGEGGPFTKDQIAEKLNPATVFKAAVEERSVSRDFEGALSLFQQALADMEK